MAVANYSAQHYDIVMTQGDDLVEPLVFSDDDGAPMDLSAYQFLSQVRRGATDSTVVATFSIDDSEAADGKIVRHLAASATAEMSGTYVHDLQWQDEDGRVRTLLSGTLELENEVSR